jgi:hypothetical protein
MYKPDAPSLVPSSVPSSLTTDLPTLSLEEPGDRDAAGIQTDSSALATKAAVSAGVLVGLSMFLL